jgi:integrase
MTKPKGAVRPAKPRADFPLTPHPAGQWVKRIHGKLYSFGAWADPEAALSEYHRVRESLDGVADPDGGKVTTRRLVQDFLKAKRQLVDQGDLAMKTWTDYQAAGKRLVAFFGPAREVASLRPADFDRYRKSFPADWGAVRINNEIVRVSPMLRFAFATGAVDKPLQLGITFRRVSQKKVRAERAGKPQKFFEAAEVHSLLAHAGIQMKAMILLGVNCGYGNSDCGRLTRDMLDLESGWLSDHRHKTGILRAAQLWPETIDALAAVLAVERQRIPREYADRVFLTRYRKPWWVDGASGDPISKEFTKLRTAAGVFRKRVGFYSLRHVTQTIGERAAGSDPVAVRILMGHVDSSISAAYREGYDREPVKLICEHLRQWWLAGKPKSDNQKQAS